MPVSMQTPASHCQSRDFTLIEDFHNRKSGMSCYACHWWGLWFLEGVPGAWRTEADMPEKAAVEFESTP